MKISKAAERLNKSSASIYQAIAKEYITPDRIGPDNMYDITEADLVTLRNIPRGVPPGPRDEVTNLALRMVKYHLRQAGAIKQYVQGTKLLGTDAREALKKIQNQEVE
ncbi:MAG: hypothetical protein GY757_19030 [bacterium]|nr:hypothetical protein [bacterium]